MDQVFRVERMDDAGVRTVLMLHAGCGGHVTDAQTLFSTDYWCVYCGLKWNDEGTIVVEVLDDMETE